MKWKVPFLMMLYALSVAIRIYPAFVSPIPYNYDALLEARFAQFIANHGNMHIPPNVAYNNHHTPITPFLNALLGAISQMTGVNVLTFLPFIFPFIVSLGVFGWYLLAKKVTRKDEIAAFTALMFVISGTYVLHTTLIWKQALGMALMPYAIYTYKKRNAVSIFLLVLLPLVHHYVALITYLVISYETIYSLYLKYKNHEPYNNLDYFWTISAVLLWGYLAAYYISRHFDRINELSPNGYLWLFISIFVLLGLVTLRVFSMRYKRIKIVHHVAISAIPLLIYILYFLIPVFPDTPKFNEYTLIFTFGYLLLLPFITIGYYILMLTEHREKKIFLATLSAPLHMILFFFLRGFDLVSYVSISRTFDFTDFSWFSAVSTAAYTRKHRIAAFAVIAIILTTTTPLTYFSMEAFGVNSFVYADEYHTAEWIKEYMGNISVDSDERIGHVLYNSFDINSGYMLPYELKNDISPASRYWVVSETWKNGAQLRPMPPVAINVTALKEQNSVIFSTGRTYLIYNNTA